jgi:hypothetical protein
LTIAALASIAAERLIDTFYECVSPGGAIRRERLDWEAGNLWGNWLELSPLLSRWIEHVTVAGDWRGTLLQGLHSYEAQRIAFVAQGSVEHAIASGQSWAAFDTPVHLSAASSRLQKATSLDASLLQAFIVVLCRRGIDGFAVYLVDADRRHDLIGGDSEMLGVFTSN